MKWSNKLIGNRLSGSFKTMHKTMSTTSHNNFKTEYVVNSRIEEGRQLAAMYEDYESTLQTNPTNSDQLTL